MDFNNTQHLGCVFCFGAIIAGSLARRKEQTITKEDQKHLYASTRQNIELCLAKAMSFKQTADLIGKDCTTVSREVRRRLVSVFSGTRGRAFNNCENRDLTRDKISLMMKHINSYARVCLNDRSPYAIASTMFGEETLKKLGAVLIHTDEITLRPSLLK